MIKYACSIFWKFYIFWILSKVGNVGKFSNKCKSEAWFIIVETYTSNTQNINKPSCYS